MFGVRIWLNQRRREKARSDVSGSLAQIKELQDEVGIKLFKRTSKKMLLTSQGEDVYKDAKKILDSVREATEKTKNLQDNLAGK